MTVFGFLGPNDTSFELGQRDGRWSFGSAATASFAVGGPNIPGIACVLERQHHILIVRSKEPSCPIFVDGNRVLAAEITVGSRLQIGAVAFIAVAQLSDRRSRIIGESPTFLRTLERAMRVAPSDCSMLLLGETGTGKEVLAQAVHQASKRRNGPFVAINCGAIPRELLAAELFGHDKGAFTGASHDRDGVFVQAHGGTLFLDEIGELPMDQQAHLLRVLETRRVRPVGSARELPVDVRILAATHRSQGLGAEGAMLRLDLYHRIATVVVDLPPLRQRPGDVELLALAALEEHARDGVTKLPSPSAMHALTNYEWPGNVRELRHAVARAVALGGPILEIEDFFPGALFAPAASQASTAGEGATLAPYEELLRQAMGRALVLRGSIRKAAKELGMPKSTFAERAKSYGLLEGRLRRSAVQR